ncbi:hypothetical protein ARMGADRAFT_1071752 [Armillaria gallica]|uniref:RRM domain-containing protein n=1 Tax=Armillaria gallica TaxID=47427 RepID=A0A2H3EHD4_ARMGA|nr:hypothetical protein ARMGADRAFT_1071752 [Armillaria gallica]
MSSRGRSTSPKPLQDRDRDASMSPPVSPNANAKVVIVTHLTRNVVESHLQTIFGFYGHITKIDLPLFGKSGQNRGKAAVEYSDPPSAHKAASHMNGGQLDGAILKCGRVRVRPNHVGAHVPSLAPTPDLGHVHALHLEDSVVEEDGTGTEEDEAAGEAGASIVRDVLAPGRALGHLHAGVVIDSDPGGVPRVISGEVTAEGPGREAILFAPVAQGLDLTRVPARGHHTPRILSTAGAGAGLGLPVGVGGAIVGMIFVTVDPDRLCGIKILVLADYRSTSVSVLVYDSIPALDSFLNMLRSSQ